MNLTKRHIKNKKNTIKSKKGGGPGFSMLGPSQSIPRTMPVNDPQPPHPPSRQTRTFMSVFKKTFAERNELGRAVANYFRNKNNRPTIISKYGDISDWDTSRITDMSYIFAHIWPLPEEHNDLVVLRWNTANVTNMAHMFESCRLNFKIEFTDTTNVTNMDYMFYSTYFFNQPLPESFNTSNVIIMRGMFYGATSFNQPLPESFNTSRVTNMLNMFNDATSFNQPLPESFNTSRVTNMLNMFNDATSFNQPLPESFNTSNVITMRNMFYGATSFNQPLPESFNTSNVTTMHFMFYKAVSFNKPLPDSFDTSKVTDMHGMFLGATNFNQPVNFNTSEVIDIAYMFYNAISFNQPVTFNLRRVRKITDIDNMFQNTKNLMSPVNITFRIADNSKKEITKKYVMESIPNNRFGNYQRVVKFIVGKILQYVYPKTPDDIRKNILDTIRSELINYIGPRVPLDEIEEIVNKFNLTALENIYGEIQNNFKLTMVDNLFSGSKLMEYNDFISINETGIETDMLGINKQHFKDNPLQKLAAKMVTKDQLSNLGKSTRRYIKRVARSAFGEPIHQNGEIYPNGEKLDSFLDSSPESEDSPYFSDSGNKVKVRTLKNRKSHRSI